MFSISFISLIDSLLYYNARSSNYVCPPTPATYCSNKDGVETNNRVQACSVGKDRPVIQVDDVVRIAGRGQSDTGITRDLVQFEI